MLDTNAVMPVTEYSFRHKLSFLDDEVQDALTLFVERLREVEGDNLLSVVLFGSMARNDFDDESDTDIFVLLREGNNIDKMLDIADLAYNTAYEVCYESGDIKPFVLISPFVEVIVRYRVV